MSATPTMKTLQSKLEEAQRIAREVFDAQLQTLGLTADQINGQSLVQLEASLGKVNEAIANADKFAPVRVKATGENNFIIAKSDSSANFEISILPILLDRKALILDRISSLRPEEQLNSLRDDIADEVDDPEAREQLFDILNRRVEEAREAAEKLDREREETAKERVDAWEREQRVQIEIRERRWAIYRSFIERESMASIVGAILLVALAASLVIGMFTHTTAPEVVINAFLLILGYFFGQSSSKSHETTKSDDSEA